MRENLSGQRLFEFLLVLILVTVVVIWRAPKPTQPQVTTSTSPFAKVSPEVTPGRWGPYTERTREVLNAAFDAAIDEGSPNVDCRHLVMGLHQEDSQVRAYLDARNLSLPKTPLAKAVLLQSSWKSMV